MYFLQSTKALLTNIFKTIIGAVWTVQRAKAFAVKPDDPSDPGTCLVEGQTDQLRWKDRRTNWYKLSSDFHMCRGMQIPSPQIKECNLKNT